MNDTNPDVAHFWRCTRLQSCLRQPRRPSSWRFQLAISVFFFFSTCLAACGPPEAGSDDSEFSLQPLIDSARATYRAEALTYLEAALDTLAMHHVFGSDYDWEELRLAALERTEGASSIEETYHAIRFVLRDIDDPHTYFVPPPSDTLENSGQDSINGRNRPSQYTSPSQHVNLKAQLIDSMVAYIELPRFSGIESSAAEEYVSSVQSIIREFGSYEPCGWIVDLRSNTGGNMWPMLAGAGPLLGAEHVGSFVDRDGDTIPWYYRDGKSLMDTAVMAQISPAAGAVQDVDTPLAVLVSARTASSGEAAAIAMRGRRRSKFFGQPTAGAATAHDSFELSDGALLGFSTYYYADRKGRMYDGPLRPDSVVRDSTRAELVERAVSWIKEVYDCAV